MKHLISNATAVSVDASIGTVPNCDVLIEDDNIIAVGPNLARTDGVSIIDATNAIVSPGFVDTHRHTSIFATSMVHVTLLMMPTWETTAEPLSRLTMG